MSTRSTRRTLALKVTAALAAMTWPNEGRAQRRGSDHEVGALSFMHVRQSTFLARLAGTRVLFDPWFSSLPASHLVASAPAPAVRAQQVGVVDAIFVTQGVPDRVDAGSVRALEGRRAYCFVPDERVAKIFRHEGFRRVRVVAAGDRVRLFDGVITVAPAPVGGVGGNQVGYHLSVAGRTLWHTGAPPPLSVDDSTAEFARSHPAELVFGCASGFDLGDRQVFLSEADAYLLASLARARYLIPHSLDVTPAGIGHLLSSRRNEAPLPVVANGPKIFRARRGKWVFVARPTAP